MREATTGRPAGASVPRESSPSGCVAPGPDADLDLVLTNKCIGQGQAVKVGENFGLRVTDIRPVEDKISALGGG